MAPLVGTIGGHPRGSTAVDPRSMLGFTNLSILSDQITETAPTLDPAVPASLWWAHADLMDQLFHDLRPQVVIEVGVFMGSSLFLMAELARRHGLNTGFIGVDPWQDGDVVWRPGFEAMATAETLVRKVAKSYPNVLLIKGTSLKAAKTVPDRSADLVHIDAEHTYEAVTADWRAWEPKVRRGGMMAFHDIGFVPPPGDSRAACGVYKFWRERVAEGRMHFSDTRGAGLGLLVVE